MSLWQDSSSIRASIVLLRSNSNHKYIRSVSTCHKHVQFFSLGIENATLHTMMAGDRGASRKLAHERNPEQSSLD